MRLNPKGKLFFGTKIDSKLRDALAHATPGDRRYFEDASSEFLRILPLGEDQYIGKLLDGGLAPNEVEDIQRNVLSILNRVAPGVRHSAASMRVYVVDESPGVVATPEPPSGGRYSY